MTQAELLYRAFQEYRKCLRENREHSLLKRAIAAADDGDKIILTKVTCQIEEDWVEAAERGLEFIERALGEERQFIRSNGEVQNIEKVKHVSRESVEHLARHSDYILQRPESAEDDIIPQKLYTVERLNDYTVYENRFLYLLLIQLRDFVGLRYQKITKLVNTYHGAVTMKKTVKEGKHRLEYELNFKETREDDGHLRSRNEAESVLSRLDAILSTVHHFLRTPLMVEVAKTDKLRQPVTKTNILRMDKNFKETVALYEFLLGYNKDGYTITREEKALDLTDSVAEEFSEPMLLLSFLAYEHNLGLEESLQEAFECEEKRRKEEEKRLLLELFANGEVQSLHHKNESLQKTVSDLNEQLAATKEAHAREIQALLEELEKSRRALEEEAAAHAEKILLIEQENREEIARVREEGEELLRTSEARLAEKEHECKDLQAALEAAEREDALSKARLTAIRHEHGLIPETDDYTSEEAFTELEHQFEVFAEFVRVSWADAKKRLKKEFFSSLKESLADKFRKKPKNDRQESEIADANGEEKINSSSVGSADSSPYTEEPLENRDE